MRLSDLDLTRWKTRAEILRMLNQNGTQISDRSFRKWVEDFNKTYDGRKQPEYIVHGPKGYKITKDRAEIKRSIADNDRRAITILRQTRRVRRFLGMKDQLSLLDDTEE